MHTQYLVDFVGKWISHIACIGENIAHGPRDYLQLLKVPLRSVTFTFFTEAIRSYLKQYDF